VSQLTHTGRGAFPGGAWPALLIPFGLSPTRKVAHPESTNVGAAATVIAPLAFLYIPPETIQCKEPQRGESNDQKQRLLHDLGSRNPSAGQNLHYNL
jgi:hypothetical protein